MAIVIIRTAILYLTLLIAMRLMGKRQLGELELPELVVAVLIADLGAHPLQDIGIPFMNGLLPIIVLVCCEILLSGLAMKNQHFRLLMFGKPCFLIEKGKIVQKQMRKNRFTLDELTEELRGKGITDISQVEYAVLETNGLVNTVLFPEFRTVQNGDLDIVKKPADYPVTIINDGKVMEDNLRLMGRDLPWLQKELKSRRASSPKDVYLLTLDSEGNIYYAAMEVTS